MSIGTAQIISISSEFSRLMIQVGGDLRLLGQQSIEDFSELTRDLSSQMNGHGWKVLLLSGAGAAAGAAAPFLPKAADAAASPALNPRLNANAALTDSLSAMFKSFTEKFGGNLGPVCNTASQFLSNGAPTVANAWNSGKTTPIEGKRDIRRLHMQELPQKEQTCNQEVRRVNDLITTLQQLEAK